MNDEQKLRDLRAKLDKFVADVGLRDWHVGFEIVIEAQEQGRVRVKPFWVPPEVWNPESKLRRVYSEIVALRRQTAIRKTDEVARN